MRLKKLSWRVRRVPLAAAGVVQVLRQQRGTAVGCGGGAGAAGGAAEGEGALAVAAAAAKAPVGAAAAAGALGFRGEHMKHFGGHSGGYEFTFEAAAQHGEAPARGFVLQELVQAVHHSISSDSCHQKRVPRWAMVFQ